MTPIDQMSAARVDRRVCGHVPTTVPATRETRPVRVGLDVDSISVSHRGAASAGREVFSGEE